MKIKLSNKAIAITGIIVTAVVSLTVYFLQKQDNPRYQLTYYLSEPFLVVNRSESLPSIKVLDLDNKLVEGPVYVTKLVVWNSGTETIPYEEVIEPIRVDGSGNIKRILSNPEEAITGLVRASRANFALPSHLTTPKLFTLQWEKFDPRAAVEIQITFEGLDSPPTIQPADFRVSGELVKGKLIQGNEKATQSRTYRVVAVLGILLIIWWVRQMARDLARGRNESHLWSLRKFISNQHSEDSKPASLQLLFLVTILSFLAMVTYFFIIIVFPLFRPALNAPL